MLLNSYNWSFITGRLRRTVRGQITDEEILAIETAFSIERNASFIVHSAQLYQERSANLYYNSYSDQTITDINKSNMFAKKAIAAYK